MPTRSSTNPRLPSCVNLLRLRIRHPPHRHCQPIELPTLMQSKEECLEGLKFYGRGVGSDILEEQDLDMPDTRGDGVSVDGVAHFVETLRVPRRDEAGVFDTEALAARRAYPCTKKLGFRTFEI